MARNRAPAGLEKDRRVRVFKRVPGYTFKTLFQSMLIIVQLLLGYIIIMRISRARDEKPEKESRMFDGQHRLETRFAVDRNEICARVDFEREMDFYVAGQKCILSMCMNYVLC